MQQFNVDCILSLAYKKHRWREFSKLWFPAWIRCGDACYARADHEKMTVTSLGIILPLVGSCILFHSKALKESCIFILLKVQSCKPQGQRISVEYRGGASFPEGNAGLSPNSHLDYNIFSVVFIAGSGLYRKTPPQGNVLLEVCKCIGVSVCHSLFFKHDSEVAGQKRAKGKGGVTFGVQYAAPGYLADEL